MAPHQGRMAEGPEQEGGFAGTDPQAVPGTTHWHDPYALGSAPGRARDKQFINPQFDPDTTRVWGFTLRVTLWTGPDETQEQAIDLLDRWMVGERGPHLPVIAYTIDEEEDESGRDGSD
jgi:hypothetical protein